MILGSLSSDVFERRTSTGSEPFSLLIYLDATKFVLLSVCSLIEMICPKICSNSRPKSAKSPLPVDVRRSKTSLLKLPISTADNKYFCAPREGENNKKRSPPIPFPFFPSPFRLLSSSWLYGSVYVIFGGSSQHEIILAQEPITRSEQPPCPRVTAFSRTSLFLERFWREF